jgi:CHAT domain
MIRVGVSPADFHVDDPVELNVSLTNTSASTCSRVIFTVRLPAGLVRLHGPTKIEVDRVLPGESVNSQLRVRAEKPGRYLLTSTNFSYRDHLGRSHREANFAAEITVEPARDPPSQPQVTMELADLELPYDEWAIVRGRITNTGAVGVSALTVTLSGQVITDGRTAQGTLEHLPPGRSADVPFHVRAGQAGTNVPVHLDLAYEYRSRRYSVATTQGIRVVRDRVKGTGVPSGSVRLPVKVLILAANPPDTETLRIDQEIREIQRIIRSGKDRDNIEVSIHLAVGTADIIQALLDDEPRLIHFAGHGGGPDGSIAVEDDYGLARVIPVDGLVHLFRTFGRSVDCVLVNACDTELLARELSVVVPYAIGMRQPVRDKSSIRFSAGFYQALAAGKSIEEAFQLGVIMLKMTPSGSDAEAPVLFRRDLPSKACA